MAINLNVWSFIVSVFCIPLFFIFTIYVNEHIFGMHPLTILLSMTLITFVLGVLGLKDVNNWKALARSIVTICFTMSLSALFIFIIVTGNLLS